MLTRVVFNQKGGVGKSSITVNLAAIAAARGYRTLIIDLDPQCNSSQYVLGEAAIEGSGAHPNMGEYYSHVLQTTPKSGLIGSTLGNILKNKENAFDSYIHSTAYDRLSIIPASHDLADMEHALQSKHKIFKLRDSLQSISQKFDLVFIDTPPAFNFYTLSALIAADRVLIPFDGDVFSHRALHSLLENILETQADHNTNLVVEGVVVNQFNPQAKLSKQSLTTLQEEGLPVFENKLPSSIVMKESHQLNKPLIHSFKDHKLTASYNALFDELVKR